MEQHTFDHDITVFCVTASSFPEGAKAAHQELHKMVDLNFARKHLGLTFPQADGTMLYKAAADELAPGELSGRGLEEYVVRAGTYVYIAINDYMSNIQNIRKAFAELMQRSDTDRPEVGIEWYRSMEEVWCMMRLRG